MTIFFDFNRDYFSENTFRYRLRPDPPPLLLPPLLLPLLLPPPEYDPPELPEELLLEGAE
jgi:hypothetical protein